MFFPFSVKQTLRIDTQATISSGPYVLNHIAAYMEDYGMVLQQKTVDLLYYTKGDLLRTNDRKSLLRHVVFRVAFPQNQVEITLESETILFVLVGVLAGSLLFIREPLLPFWITIGAAVGIWCLGWLQKWFLLRLIKKELRPILERI